MPIAAIIALVETYGPTVWTLAVKYGPTIFALAKQYGPAIKDAVGPMIAASAKSGTLEQDAAALVSKVQALAPLLGNLSSLADLADAIGSIGGAPVESPAMERVAGSKAR